MDEPVWLTREGVAQGRDDVVEATRNWIGTFDVDMDGTINADDNCEMIYNPDQEDTDGDNIGDSYDV
ncbi:MAG: hypothetical protein JXA92_03610 [candidate division Zixibacteria bacterium]|nr:hypothetical protein [candidate division Zixibacteria bacterium]